MLDTHLINSHNVICNHPRGWIPSAFTICHQTVNETVFSDVAGV